jgi:hypothetical protein
MPTPSDIVDRVRAVYHLLDVPGHEGSRWGPER